MDDHLAEQGIYLPVKTRIKVVFALLCKLFEHVVQRLGNLDMPELQEYKWGGRLHEYVALVTMIFSGIVAPTAILVGWLQLLSFSWLWVFTVIALPFVFILSFFLLFILLAAVSVALTMLLGNSIRGLISEFQWVKQAKEVVEQEEKRRIVEHMEALDLFQEVDARLALLRQTDEERWLDLANDLIESGHLLFKGGPKEALRKLRALKAKLP